VQAPDRLVDASIDRSALVAQGPSGQDEEYGRGPTSGKRLIHEIPRSFDPLIHGFHSLSTTPAVVASLTEDERPWLGVSVVQVPETLEFFRAWAMPGRRIANFAFLERLDAGPDLSIAIAGPLPAPFPGPTLILAGRQDNVSGWADAIPLLDSFPRATYAVLDRAGHAVPAEQNVLFRALVEEWLDRLELEEAS
jgi:pimeloyl-ACP methyl ester carboxylesterase